MYTHASSLFDIIIERIESSQIKSFAEGKDALWKQYLDKNLGIFGNHTIYNIALDGIEKKCKRHLPRKTEKFIKPLER
jgi:hypothetical protein